MVLTDLDNNGPALQRRSLLLGTASLLLAGCAPPVPAPPAVAAGPLTLLGEATIPYRFNFRDTTVGGLSAIDYDPVTGLFDLLSDDRSAAAPARLYRARLGLSAEGLHPPELLDVITLKQANGQAWPGRKNAVSGVPVPDPEALRRLPNGNFLWTSEGDLMRG
ncbi:MAG: esterase-like activity of phytase family protein, partial [Polaromonas sp.]